MEVCTGVLNTLGLKLRRLGIAHAVGSIGGRGYPPIGSIYYKIGVMSTLAHTLIP